MINNTIIEEDRTDFPDTVGEGPIQGLASPSWSFGLGLLGFVFLFLFVSQLRGEWQANPHYAFGWGVPFLGMMLFARRWKDRPEPRREISSATLWIIGGALALWLPIRILREANTDWRL